MIYIKPEVYGSSDLTSGGSQIRPPQDLACHMTAKRLKPYIFLGPALVQCWSYNMSYMKRALALDFYARCFLQCFQLACAAVPRCTVSVKISMKAPPVQPPPPPPPVFCRPHLAARREAPIITASEGKKCTTPHCTIAQFVLTKRHCWYLPILNQMWHTSIVE